MSDPFLSLPGTKRKRPSRPNKPADRSQTRPTSRSQKAASQKDKSAFPRKRRLRDESPEAGDDDEVGAGAIDSDDAMDIEDVESEESDLEESAADKRLRLAKAYLDQVRSEAGTIPSSKNLEYRTD